MAFEKELTRWKDEMRANPDSDSPMPNTWDYHFENYLPEKFRRTTIRPETAAYGVAAVALFTAAFVANRLDCTAFAEPDIYLDE